MAFRMADEKIGRKVAKTVFGERYGIAPFGDGTRPQRTVLVVQKRLWPAGARNPLYALGFHLGSEPLGKKRLKQLHWTNT